MHFRIIYSDSALYMKAKTNEMLGYLSTVEDRRFKSWCESVPDICNTQLAKNLIIRNPPFVKNNFNSEVSLTLTWILMTSGFM